MTTARPAACLALLALMGLGACASPEVVQVSQVGDNGLDCRDLAREMDEADRFERRARDERGVTGTNVAAVLLFWPALLATYANTEDAIEAARDRKDSLAAIARDKGC